MIPLIVTQGSDADVLLLILYILLALVFSFLCSIAEAVLLSAGTSDTGPGGNISISGSQSWESLYTINGVVVNENIRGQATDLGWHGSRKNKRLVLHWKMF